jgi:lipoprotein-anchoring transpeptidase ErfK/SrfK
VYRAGELIGVSTISSGKPGKNTPPGIFPILEKKRMHHSRKYDNAPMPFMQRLDQYGIALHAGAIPGRPASHGCVRLPAAFAAKLFAMTQVGDRVVIG